MDEGGTMDALQQLEQKINSLVGLVKNLREKNIQLKTELEVLSKEQASLKNENAKLAEENARLVDKIESMEKEVLKDNGQIDELNQEKVLTKIAVDDLLERLKVIDSIVEQP